MEHTERRLHYVGRNGVGRDLCSGVRFWLYDKNGKLVMFALRASKDIPATVGIWFTGPNSEGICCKITL